MALGWVAILVLAGLLVYQQYFYAELIKDLTSRLMSRDFRDYEQARNPAPPRVIIKPPEPPMENFDRIVG